MKLNLYLTTAQLALQVIYMLKLLYSNILLLISKHFFYIFLQKGCIGQGEACLRGIFWPFLTKSYLVLAQKCSFWQFRENSFAHKIKNMTKYEISLCAKILIVQLFSILFKIYHRSLVEKVKTLFFFSSCHWLDPLPGAYAAKWKVS